MDIKQAKEEIRRTVLAYTERDALGALRIPMVRQRPLLLMGPPGVGKTAIFYQLAQELGVNLVSYTMTHHTRQSALGLPVLREKTFGGKTYTATEYTMSEILASVYERIEKTGIETGILFLDEINCVSETLMPAMLQLLQSKQFGTHRLPEGWVIAAAGNPPAYNESARTFDTVTMDRVRLLQIEADYHVWRDYAHEKGLHPAVLSYLELNPEHFFCVERHAHGRSFVTARGWEDLSQLLTSYERLGFEIQDALFGEFLQHEEIAAAFSSFFHLFTACRERINLANILSGQVTAAAPELRAMRFDARLAATEFLLHAVCAGAEYLPAEKGADGEPCELSVQRAIGKQSAFCGEGESFPAGSCDGASKGARRAGTRGRSVGAGICGKRACAAGPRGGACAAASCGGRWDGADGRGGARTGEANPKRDGLCACDVWRGAGASDFPDAAQTSSRCGRIPEEKRTIPYALRGDSARRARKDLIKPNARGWIGSIHGHFCAGYFLRIGKHTSVTNSLGFFVSCGLT